MEYKFVSKPAFSVIGKIGFTRGLYLAGAVYDFTDPASGEEKQYFPIDRTHGNEVL